MPSATNRHLSPQEYLRLERKSPTRNEYFRGEIFAMAGASREHSLIAGNLCWRIGKQLEDRPGEVYVSQMRLLVDATGLYTYPDVVVVCGEPEFLDREVDTLLNPTVLFEVLSGSTEAYDRGVKFGHYRKIPSLREYVMISQDRMLVERYTRQGNDWLLSELTGEDQVLRLDSIGCEVPLDRIYAKVKFEEGGTPGERGPRDESRPRPGFA